jgi:hypothetical protein
MAPPADGSGLSTRRRGVDVIARAIVTIAAAGCTTVGSSGVPNPVGAPGDPATMDAGADAGAVASDAGVPTDGGSVDGGPIVPKVSLWNLAVGHVWTYDLSLNQCRVIVSIPATTDIGTRHAFVETYTTDCPGGFHSVGSILEAVYPDDRKEKGNHDGSSFALIEAPGEGRTWNSLSIIFTWHASGRVTVPAGTFDDCWTLNEQYTKLPITMNTVFCRGVGLVTQDVLNGNMPSTMVLTSKNA